MTTTTRQTHSSAAAGTLLELDARRRITLGRLANHDRYTARVMPNGSILLEPAVVVSADEAAMMQNPEFVEMIRQRIADTKGGAGQPISLEEIRAKLADLGDDENDELTEANLGQRVEVYATEHGKFRFRLKSSSGQIVWESAPFETKQAAHASAAALNLV